MGYAEYANAVQRGSIVPKDEFQHKKYVLESEPELATEFHKLIDAQLKLANISDAKELTLVQYQIFNLIDLFQLSVREKSLVPVFRYCYYCWKGGLSMTRAKKGRERGLQAMVGMTSAESEGFSDLITEGDKEEGQFFEKLAGVRSKLKNRNNYGD